MKQIVRKALILPIVVMVALILVIFKVMSGSSIQHEELQFPVKSVQFITARKLPFRSRATGYGNVAPAILLRARSEVGGKVSYIHPSLKDGASLAKGTIVLRIEPTAFEFSLDQSKAGLAGSQSSLEQLETEEKSTKRSLEIARINLLTGERELERILSIWDKRLVARSVVDSEEQKVLQLRQQVVDLQGKAASFSSRKSATKAQIDRSETQLAQSQDTLGRTEITLPFDARIGQVAVETDEYTAVGSLLFEAVGREAVEINAQLPLSQFYPLIIGLGIPTLNLQNVEMLQSEFSKIKLGANVSLVGNSDSIARWQGELLRIGQSIDPTRDTIGLIVAVNNPYSGVVPGRRPPLLTGMYAAVEFFTPAREMLVLPRKAIHQERVYIALANDTLTIRPVSILYKQGDLVVINQGVKVGERIVITDVIPVIEGLPLRPVAASNYEEQLARNALGDDQFGPTNIIDLLPDSDKGTAE